MHFLMVVGGGDVGSAHEFGGDFGALPTYERLFEGSLTGESGISGPCLYTRGCFRPVSLAGLCFWGGTGTRANGGGDVGDGPRPWPAGRRAPL